LLNHQKWIVQSLQRFGNAHAVNAETFTTINAGCDDVALYTTMRSCADALVRMLLCGCIQTLIKFIAKPPLKFFFENGLSKIYKVWEMRTTWMPKHSQP
jgi:hypothetical protein